VDLTSADLYDTADLADLEFLADRSESFLADMKLADSVV